MSNKLRDASRRSGSHPAPCHPPEQNVPSVRKLPKLQLHRRTAPLKKFLMKTKKKTMKLKYRIEKKETLLMATKPPRPRPMHSGRWRRGQRSRATRWKKKPENKKKEANPGALLTRCQVPASMSTRLFRCSVSPYFVVSLLLRFPCAARLLPAAFYSLPAARAPCRPLAGLRLARPAAD